jgi:lipoprotein signal peptidase
VLNFGLAIAVVAHGFGHVLFLAPTLRLVEWADQSSHSWLLTEIVGDPFTRAIAAVAWATTMVLFVAAAYGFLTRHDWWRLVLIAAALVSLAAIVVMWDGIATSSAFMAAAFDVTVLTSVLWANWPTTNATTS